MKSKTLLLLLLGFLLAASAPRAKAEVSFEFFYDALSPYGEWLEVGDYGYCWRPLNVEEDWQPYSDGYWAYTDAGWTWVSYEDFGGIVYHYGRWVNTDDAGWCWVPDYEWGGAWVSWRRSDDYVGWAPLPPEAHWEQDRGFNGWVDTTYDIAPSYYSFCHTRDFGAPVLRPVIIHRRENIVIIANTVNITNISFNRHAGCAFNGGLDYAYVNRFQPRPIPALKLVRNTNVTVVNNTIINNNVRVTNFNSVQRGNQLTVLAPALVRPRGQQVAALVQPRVTRVIPREKVTRGWGSLTAEQRTTFKTKLAQETEGKTPATAPALAVKPADLKVVPVKADPNAKIATLPRKLPPMTATPAPGFATPRPERITKVPAGTPFPLATPMPGKITRLPAGTPVPLATPEPGRVIAKKPIKLPTPPPANVTTNPPGVPVPITNQPLKPVKPGVVKPFRPNDDGTNGPATGTVRRTMTPPPVTTNGNAEALRKQAAAQEAMRLRTQQATEAKQKMLQQQQQDQNAQAVVRQRALEQQQMAKERAAQAGEAKQRALESQQQQQQAARAKMLQQQQQQQNQQQQQIQPRRNPNPPPGPTIQKVPPKPGKRPLTPEEAARLKNQ